MDQLTDLLARYQVTMSVVAKNYGTSTKEPSLTYNATVTAENGTTKLTGDGWSNVSRADALEAALSSVATQDAAVRDVTEAWRKK